MKTKTKSFFRLRFGSKLSKEDLRGYHAILRLLYHKKAEKPLVDSLKTKFFIRVPKLHLDLILTSERAEIVNSKQIYPLELNKLVLERATKRIKEVMSQDIEDLEVSIRGRKQTIFDNVYKKIK
jgi:hypothetical protein